MRRAASRLGLAALLLSWSGWLLLTGTSSGTLPMQKKARELGFAAENCLYCHGEKLPKKEAVSYNDRGKWLIAEKEKRKAAEVDMAWLKDYPGEKK
ncbi:MAG: hypothetical protein ACRD3M_06105 [Thermoanaerobaculia bacterium]